VQKTLTPIILALILFILEESGILQDSLIAAAVQEINWKASLGRESVEIGND
jgi:hypothetical protein